jgi:hypothetical protein
MGEFFKKPFSNKKKDFDQNFLPIDRKQLFKKIITTRLGKLFQINLICFLFLLPLISWDLLTNIYKSSLNGLSELVHFSIYTKSPITILFTIIFFFSLAGGIYYIRRLAWGEPVTLLKTFIQGVKQSYKQFLILGFITSLFICLFDLAITMMNNTNLSGTYNIIFTALLCFALILFLSVISYCLTLSSLYVMRLSTIFKTSVIFTLKKFPLNILFILITYGIVAGWFIVGIVYLYFIGIIITAIIGISYSILAWVLYTNSSYDIYINLKQYPAIYRKGLRPLTKEGATSA